MKGSPPKAAQAAALDPATEAVERLLLVTLALEETLQADQFAESDALFTERAAILAELADLSLTPKSRIAIDRVQAAEKRIIGYLADWRTAVGKEIGKSRTGKKANTAYLGAVLGRSFSMDARH